jgi:hypothetical protein
LGGNGGLVTLNQGGKTFSFFLPSVLLCNASAFKLAAVGLNPLFETLNLVDSEAVVASEEISGG